jgi:hypothetical protein
MPIGYYYPAEKRYEYSTLYYVLGMYVCMYVPSIRNAVNINGYILFIRLVYPPDKDFFRMGVLLRTAAHICLTLTDHLFHVHW